MRYCSTEQRQAKPSAGDPAHLSPARGDTLPAPAKPQPPLDWPAACEAPPAGAAPAAISGIVAAWSVAAVRDAADGGLLQREGGSSDRNGDGDGSGGVPSVYRLLDATEDRAASDASSTSDP